VADGSNVQDPTYTAVAAVLGFQGPLVAIDIAEGFEQRGFDEVLPSGLEAGGAASMSYWNAAEAAVVEALVRALLERWREGGEPALGELRAAKRALSVGVIAPYRCSRQWCDSGRAR
jgi:hypothetical protein